jgi:hypothetical protein
MHDFDSDDDDDDLIRLNYNVMPYFTLLRTCAQTATLGTKQYLSAFKRQQYT